MKYSKANERDFKFYLTNRKVFSFCGTGRDSITNTPIFDKRGVSGKHAFFSIENNGKNIPTKHPNLLSSLLLAKASVNFNIRMWAEGRADGTLPLIEFSQKTASIKYPHLSIEIDGKDIETELNLPQWIVTAVENQKGRFYK